MKMPPAIYCDGGCVAQPFAFGGVEGPGAFDSSVRNCFGLQSLLTDTGEIDDET